MWKGIDRSDSEKLKSAILHYSESILAFAREVDIPHVGHWSAH